MQWNLFSKVTLLRIAFLCWPKQAAGCELLWCMANSVLDKEHIHCICYNMISIILDGVGLFENNLLSYLLSLWMFATYFFIII